MAADQRETKHNPLAGSHSTTKLIGLIAVEVGTGTRLEAAGRFVFLTGGLGRGICRNSSVVGLGSASPCEPMLASLYAGEWTRLA